MRNNWCTYVMYIECTKPNMCREKANMQCWQSYIPLFMHVKYFNMAKRNNGIVVILFHKSPFHKERHTQKN